MTAKIFCIAQCECNQHNLIKVQRLYDKTESNSKKQNGIVLKPLFVSESIKYEHQT